MKRKLLLFLSLITITLSILTDVLAQVPTIIAISPTSGPVGTTVSITGTNFNTTAANNVVWFGAVRASVTSASSDLLSVTVPVGATYQPIAVTVNGLTAYSARPFNVTFQSSRVIDASSFAPKSLSTVGSFPYDIAIADFDDDGKPDVATANFNGNTVSILRNTGTSGSVSFAAKVDSSAGGNPYGIAVFDLDGDGKQDIAVTNWGDNTVSVLRNLSTTGNISFASRLNYAVGSHPEGIAIADIDGDGKPDLAATNASGSSVSILRNTSTSGSVSFAAKVDAPVGSSPVRVAIADIDGDGKPDIVVPNYGSDNVSILRNTSTTGSVSFATKVNVTVGSLPYGIAIADIDGDGKPDVVVPYWSGTVISILQNTSTSGSVSFASKMDFAAGSSPWGVAVGDIDGDGKPDVEVSNSGTVSLLRNTSTSGSVSFAAKVDFAVGGSPRAVAVADIDGDGKPDVSTAHSSFTSFWVLRNTVGPPNNPPATPQNLIATVGNGQVTLKWTKNTEADFLKYRIYMGADSTTLSLKDSTVTGVADTVFNITGLTNGTKYYFRVSALDSARLESGQSYAVSATPNGPPAAPQNLTATAGNGQVTLKWSKNTESDFLKYRIYMGSDSTTLSLKDSSSATILDTTKTITGLTNGTKYYFRVSALDSARLESGQSYAASATPAVLNALREYNPDTSTVLLLHMNEAAGSSVADASGKNNIGTATATTVSVGKFGNARRLSGASDYVVFNHDPSITLTSASNPTTIETWIRTSNTGFQSVFAKAALNIGYAISTVNGRGRMWMEDNLGSLHQVDLTGSSIVSDGQWHHLAFVLTGTQLQIWVDGVLDAATSTSVLSGNLSSTANLTVGGSQGQVPFDGVIDEIRYSKIVRSPQEFNLQLPPMNLAATPSGSTVNLTWQNGGGAVPLMKYRIYRGFDSTSVVLTDSTTSISKANVTTLYYYRISAVDSTGFEGAKSFAVYVPTPIVNTGPAAPQNLTATAGNGQVTLKWRRNTEADFLKYRIYMGADSTTLSLKDSTVTGVADTVSTITGLTNGTKYYFRVSALDSARLESGQSYAVSATPLGPPIITSFSPTSGPVGTTVSITGTNFNTTAANNVVWFGAVRAAVTSASSALLSVTVPVGATYQPIAVTVNGLTAYSARPFNVTFPSSRTIDATLFAAKADFSVTGFSDIAINDFNGDGKPDLAMGYNTSPTAFSVLQNTSSVNSVSFVSQNYSTSASDPAGATVGDFDGDGRVDVAVVDDQNGTVAVLRNTSTGGAIAFATRINFASGGPLRTIASSDLDGDGKPDLVVGYGTSGGVGGQILVYRNTSAVGTISFAAAVEFDGGTYPNSVALQDLDGDGKPDIVVANNEYYGTVSILRNTSTIGTISFAAKASISLGIYPYCVAIGDLDGDGKPDLAVSNNWSDNVSILLSTSAVGSISFATPVNLSTGTMPRGVVVGDLDGDGKPDLATANGSGSNISIFRNKSSSGSVSFAPKINFGTGSSPTDLAIADIDCDGKPDLAVSNGITISVFRNIILTPPPAPILASPASGTTNQPTSLWLRWNPSLSATSYRVQLGTDSSFTSGVVLDDSTVADTSRNVAGLSDNTTHYWRIAAKNVAGSSPSSAVWNFRVVVPPATPQNLIAVARNTKVTLIWNKNTESDFLRYRIYRGTALNPTAKVDSTTGGVNDTSKVISGLVNGTTYYFRITAVDADGWVSGYSSNASATPGIIVLHVATTGNDANLGTASLSLRNIQTALSKAGPGDTVKVAAGSYTENLVTSTQVILKGGYPSNFTEAGRDLIAQKTTLGSGGGDIFRDNQSSTIDGFVLDGTNVPSNYNGITITAGYTIIAHNILTKLHNSGCKVIRISSGAGALVKNNTLVQNALSGGGVSVVGISLASGADPLTLIQNNIITTTGYGIDNNVSSSIADYNCINIGGGYGYYGTYTAPGTHDVNTSPRLVYPAGGDYRLKGGSPCIDAGNPSDDFSAEPSPNGGRIDIGAYGGTQNATRSGFNPSTHVSTNGSDANDGSGSSPYLTIQYALQHALGDTVKVASGTYGEGLITVSPGILRGGYAESFDEKSRNIHQYRTTIQAVNTTMWYDAYGMTVDGFYFDGMSTIAVTGLDLRAPATITHNVILNVKATAAFVSGINVEAVVTLRNNVVDNCYYGFWLESGAVGSTIKNNILVNNNYSVYNLAADGLMAFNDHYNNAYGNYSPGAPYKAMGIGEITLNPLFRNAAALDFRLQAGSPCINTGDPNPLYYDPDGSRSDMGVFYYDIPPAAPQSLSATAGNGQVTLKWRRNSESDFLKYRIYMGADSTTLSLKDSTVTGVADTVFNITGLTNGTKYYFRISALDSARLESPQSYAASATPSVLNASKEYNPDANTVLLMHMNEAAGSSVSDASGKGNGGTATGTMSVTGRFGNARNFQSGAEYITVANSGSLNFGSASFTVEGWIQSLSKNNSGTVGKVANATGFLTTYHGDIGGVITLRLDAGGKISEAWSSDTVGNGKWHHFAGIRLNNKVQVYVDGLLSGEADASQIGSISNTTPMAIGIDNGMLDEIRISNIARSPQEFNLQLPPKNLSANTSSATISLSWQNGGGSVPLMRYRIYRGADSTNVALVDSAAQLLYTNSGLPSATTFYYRVSAVDSTNFEGAKSYAVKASTKPALGEYPTDANTVLLLHMNETSGSTVSDASSFGNNGTATGTMSVSGRFGNARNLQSGAESITVANSASLNFGSASFTVEIWVNTMNTGAIIVNKFSGNGGGFNIGIASGGFIQPYLSDGVNSVGSRSTVSIADGKWHHVAVVRNPSNLSVYIDGLLATPEGSPSSVGNIDNSGNLTFGGLACTFDEIRISNIARSPQEFNLHLPPINLTATPSGSTVNLTWQNGGGAVPLMRHKICRGSDSTNVTLIDSTTQLQYANTGLSSGSTYFYRVSAVDSTGFEGANSWAAKVTVTGNIAPAPPKNLTATAGNSQVTLKWRRNAEADFLKYRIYMGSDSTTVSLKDSTATGVADTVFNITGLTNGTKYYFRVSALDSARLESPKSFAVSSTPSVNNIITFRLDVRNLIPKKRFNPTKDTVDVRGSFNNWYSMTALLSDPDLDSIYTKSIDVGSASPPDYKFVLRHVGLDLWEHQFQGTPYGNREYTPTGNPQTLPIVLFNDSAMPPPWPPRNVVGTAGDRQVTLKWNKNEEPDFLRYRIYQSSVKIDSTASGITDTVKTVLGLANNVTYSFYVTAVDSLGDESYWSSSVIATPMNLSPISPQNLTAAPGNGQVTLKWSKNTESDFLKYRIYMGFDSTTVSLKDSTATGVADTVFNITGLTNGTKYYFRVSALDNARLESPLSYAASATPTSGNLAPEAPLNLAATSGNAQVTLKWKKNSEADFLRYRIYRGTLPNPTSKTDSTTGGISDTSKVITGLVNGTIYYFRVTAVDNAGLESPFSNEVNAIPGLPAAPINLSATGVSSSQVILAWTDASSNEDGFRIERKTGSSGSYAEIAVVGSGVQTYTDSFLAEYGLYFYRVRSYNSAGNSNYTTEVIGRTKDISPPGPVTNLQISPGNWTSQSAFTLTWTNPSDASGIAKAFYRFDSAPTVVAPGDSQVVGTTPSVVVTVPSLGNHLLYVYVQDSSGNKNPSSALTTRAKFDNIPPTLVHDSSLVGKVIVLNGVALNTPTISASASEPVGQSGLRSLQLEYRKTGVMTSTVVQFTSGSASIPGTAFVTNGIANGVDYRVTADDSAGNTSQKGFFSIPVETQGTFTAPTSFLKPAASFTVAERVKAYRLFSVPLDLTDKKPRTLLQSLGDHKGTSGTSYVNWRFETLTQEYEAIKDLDFVKAGQAFYFILKDTSRHATLGSAKAVSGQAMRDSGVAVSAGWNLVGDPFNFDFSIDSIQAVGTSIQNTAYYNGDGPSSGWWMDDVLWSRTFRRWEGLAVKVTNAGWLRFKVTPPKSGIAIGDFPTQALDVLQKAGGEETGWMVRVDASRLDNTMVALNNLAGMHPSANEGYDKFDWFMPPFVGPQNVAVFFKNETENLVRDIRPVNQVGGVWEMKVKTGDVGAHLQLQLSHPIAPENGLFRTFLIDLDESMAYDILKTPRFEINSKNGLRNFRLVVGTTAYIEEHSGGVDLVPRTLTLAQNYPNPFNPTTVIRYTVPAAKDNSHVKVRIHNLLGQEVAVLVDREQEAGYYEVSFEAGKLATGVYICSLEFGKQRLTRKMVLLK